MKKTFKLKLQSYSSWDAWYKCETNGAAICANEIWNYFEKSGKSPRTIWITLSDKKMPDSHRLKIQSHDLLKGGDISFVGDVPGSYLCEGAATLVRKLFGKKLFYVRLEY